MRRRIKKHLKIGSLIALAASASLVGTSCNAIITSFNNSGVFRYFYNTDVLKDNNSPLNPNFNNSPISTYAKSALYGLVTYETLNQNDVQEGTVKYQDKLILEGATQVEVFKSEQQMQQYDLAIKDGNKTLVESNAPYIFNQGQALNEQDNYDAAVSEGTIYRFKINTQNSWIDSNGKVQAQVSGKDFERAIETYQLSSSIGYNRNGYFLSMMGLNFDKTVSYKTNNDVYAKIISPDYDIDNYANSDEIFTLHLNEPYPYTFDLLSKEYFSAVPHTNYKVRNISLADGSPIKYTKTSTIDGGTKITIDRTNTNFNEIYGSGDINNFHKDTWYASAYYISHFTNTQIIFELNNIYMKPEVMGENLLNEDAKKIKTIVETYGSGTVDTFYELFKSGQNDYLQSVPATKKSEAAQYYANNGLVLIKNSKLSQSNYITFTPKAYIVGANGVSVNNYISQNVANMIYAWNSKESTIIRAGIAGLINHNFLSYINLPSSGDFQLSSVPFGNFENYYEIVSSNDSGFLGGLPRPYSDYINTQNSIFSTGFQIPYYSYSSSGVTIETLDVNKTTFVEALKKFGASSSNKLNLMAKFGEGTFTSNYNNYLISLKSAIETISDGLINFSINARNGANPTANEWFNQQSSPIGYSYWSPDYNGVGTWLEASTLMDTATANDITYQSYPSTNAHNSWLTYFEALVSAVILMKATYTTNNSTNGYVIGDITEDPYKNDNKIQGAFSSDILKEFDVKYSAETTDKNIVKENDLPGIKYGKLAIQFLNLLIKNNIIDQAKFDAYVKDPTKLQTSTSGPENDVNKVLIGNDVFKSDASIDFSKWLGVYAGQSQLKALWSTTVNDSDYSYIPRSEAGLNELNFSLVNPNYTIRVSTVGSLNFRDFCQNK